jgi:hypothetical protein
MPHFITFLNDSDTYSSIDGSFVAVTTTEEAEAIMDGGAPRRVVDRIDPKCLFALNDPVALRQLADLLEKG